MHIKPMSSWEASDILAIESFSMGDIDKPFNISVMDVDAYIKQNSIAEVTSLSAFEPGSSLLAEDGLFSESIFGQIGTPERLDQHGYITLNTDVIAPVVFKHLTKISGLYKEIIEGRTYAVFNTNTNDFERIFGDPEDHPDADTGFSFFMKHYPDMKFPTTGSTIRDNRIELLNMYRKVSLYGRILVLPAGLRDIQTDGDRMVQDDINKLYVQLMSLSFSIPEGSTSTVFDTVRSRIQLKVVEIYDYLENIMTGKRGFLQGGGYSRRRIALGTRNVLTAATYAMQDPNDVQAIKPTESQVGIYQTAKGLQPLVIHYLKSAFFDPIIGDTDSAKIALTNPKTLSLEYVAISPKERERFVKPEMVGKWINRFKNRDIRLNPITLRSEDGKDYYLCMVYDQGDRISLFRSLSDLEAQMEGQSVDKSKIRPLTWSEALYVTTYNASRDRHCLITRYPVIEEGSSYPCKIHLVSTAGARVVQLYDLITSTVTLEYPQYPSVANDAVFLDGTTVHISSLGGLGGDFDGDTVSVDYVMSDEANQEIVNYLSSNRAYLLPERRFMIGGGSDLVKMSMAIMTK